MVRLCLNTYFMYVSVHIQTRSNNDDHDSDINCDGHGNLSKKIVNYCLEP